MFHLDEAAWVAVAFTTFVALAWKPISRTLTKGLDQRGERIKAELEEAARLREEAQTVLAAYQKKQRESLKEAKEMLDKTRQDAARIASDAETALKASIDQRSKAAMEKIAQAETAALQEVKSHVVDFAITAARTIISKHLDKSASEELIRLAVGDVERKLH